MRIITGLNCFIFFLSAFAGFAQPDSNYFQQHVDYTISVKLNDVNHTLRGFETIRYKNNSPHQLKYILFHLWPNAYKNNETDLAKQFLENGDIDFYYAPESDRGFIDSLLFKAGDDTLKWDFYKEEIKDKNGDAIKGKDGKPKKKQYIDICKVTLPKGLNPDSTVTITTPFYVKIPSGLFSRLGHIDQSYQITQWYPKPAVYDRNGWNPIPYLNQGEFYSEWGDFDVTITVPSNYVVAATGELSGCPQEERMLELKAKETEQLFKDNKVDKLGNLLGGNAFPPSSPEWKILHYVQKNVHDFAWFADKRWHVLKGEYVFEKSGKLVSLWTYFTNSRSRYWKKSIQYLNDACHYYSKWNGDYPYSILQAVDGTISAGSGMEYPTITNIGNEQSDISLEEVIMHEVGHNWFYGILASNEREHPWMDEGINSANELRYMRTKYSELTLAQALGLDGFEKISGLDTLKQRMQYYLAYKFAATNNSDQPIEGKAQDFTTANYAFIVYQKTAASFNYLRAYLGDELYDKCMHDYFNAWKFKHPQPKDIRKIFEKDTKKDLGWFFDDLIGTNKIIDYKITKKRKPSTKSRVTYGWMKYEEGVGIKNIGGIPAPIFVAGYSHDTIADARWYQGFRGDQVVSFPNGNFDHVVIDPYYDMPEINHSNNYYKYKIKGKKLFAKTEPLKLKFIGGYESEARSTLFYTPVVGGNAYDGWQFGMALYNSCIYQKPIEWAVMPLYGTRSGKLNGSASFGINSNYRESKIINKISYSLTAASYSYLPQVFGSQIDFANRFFRITPAANIDFKPGKARSPYRQKLAVSSSVVGEREKETCQGDCDGLRLVDTLKLNVFADLAYTFSSSKVLMPWSAKAHFRYGPAFAFTTLEYNVSKVVGVKGKKVYARVYAGAFLFNNTNDSRYNLRGDGIRGRYDYTYASTFIGRNETQGVWAQQFTEGFANVKTPTAYAQSNTWNAALNLSSDLPIPVLKIFGDLAVAPYTTSSNGKESTNIRSVYDFGFNLPLFSGAINIYVPVYVSKLIANEYKANNIQFYQRIRFTLNIAPFAPNRIAKSIKLF
jgi:hypothetical protein